MAISDHYLCDMCGRKTFYDWELDYPPCGSKLPNGAGDMKVLCNECAKEHYVIITAKPMEWTVGGDPDAT